MRIRLGRSEDISALRAIEFAADQQFVDAGHPEFDGDSIAPEVAKASIDRGHLFVAELDIDGQSTVVGWIQLGRCGDECSVEQVSVAPDYQQRGIGRMLMDTATAEAVRAGETTIVLNTQADIVWNRPWYESLGFAVVPRESWTEAMTEATEGQTAAGLDWSTRVHMRKAL